MKGFALGLALKQAKGNSEIAYWKEKGIGQQGWCNRTFAWWRHLTKTTRMLWGKFSIFFFCEESLVRDTIYITKVFSEMHSGSCSQVTASCRCPVDWYNVQLVQFIVTSPLITVYQLPWCVMFTSFTVIVEECLAFTMVKTFTLLLGLLFSSRPHFSMYSFGEFASEVISTLTD